MTKYIITKIKLDKLKILEVYNELAQMISYDKAFFEAAYLSDEIIKNKFWADNQMQEFIYSRNLNYAWEPDKCINIASNLNNLWEWENPNKCQSLTIKQVEELAKFIDKLPRKDYDSSFIILDNIRWDNNDIKEATCGYEKAKCTFGFGKNYLSNAIVLCNGTLEKSFMYVCREARFENNSAIYDILTKFGKLAGTEIYYAPDDETERAEWDVRQDIVQKSFKMMMENLSAYYEKLPFKFELTYDSPTNPINVKKLAKSKLEPYGWTLIKNAKGEKGIRFKKNHKDGELIAWVDSLDKGHYLQLLITYKSEKFYFHDNIDYTWTLKNEEEVKQYCINVRNILKYVESVLE